MVSIEIGISQFELIEVPECNVLGKKLEDGVAAHIIDGLEFNSDPSLINILPDDSPLKIELTAVGQSDLEWKGYPFREKRFGFEKHSAFTDVDNPSLFSLARFYAYIF